jgi:hypothetical protein
MQKATIKMKRKFLSSEVIEFSSDFGNSYVLSNTGELTQDSTAIFSRASGIHKYLYKGKIVQLTYGKGASFSLIIAEDIILEVIHIKSKWLKSNFELHYNKQKVADLVFVSRFFPYSERYELITANDTPQTSLLLFGLFSWHNHESICCL